MIWQPTTYALISACASIIPAVVGFYAWSRRGKQGAAALALLLWALALWGLLYAAELGARDASLLGTVHELRTAVLVLTPPLWLVFVFQYTGRVGWLTWSFLALIYAVPAATLALMATNEEHGLVWASEGVREAGPLLIADFEYGPWFWVDFSYAVLLVLTGAALLLLMLRNMHWLYAKQSACLLPGFVGPWAVHASYAMGLDSGLGFLPGLDPAVVAFAPAALCARKDLAASTRKRPRRTFRGAFRKATRVLTAEGSKQASWRPRSR